MRATANIAGPAYHADMSVVKGKPISRLATTSPTNDGTIPNRVRTNARIVNCTTLNGSASHGFGLISVVSAVKTATKNTAAIHSRRTSTRRTNKRKKKIMTDKAASGTTDAKALAT